MFSGQAPHTVDAKNRVFIPAMFRMELGQNFIVTKGFGEAYLIIYPMSEWEKLIGKIDELGMDKQTRDLKRYIMRSSNPTEMDAQGRIVLSKEHREYAKLTKDVILLGMNKTIEIWDAATLDGQMSEEPENLELLLSKLQ